MTFGSERIGSRAGFRSAIARRSFSGSPGSRLVWRRTVSAAAIFSGSWTQGDRFFRLLPIGSLARTGCGSNSPEA